MSANLIRFFVLYAPMNLLYIPWSASTLLYSMLNPKKDRSKKQVWLFVFCLMIPACIVRYLNPNAGTALLYVSSLVTAVTMFADSFSRKISSFFITAILQMIPESIAINLFLFAYSAIHQEYLDNKSLNYLERIPDILLMHAIYFTVAAIFIRKAADLLKKHIHSLHLQTIVPILLPIEVTSITAVLIQGHYGLPEFPLRAALYWLIGILCVLPLILSISRIQRHEREHEQLIQQTVLCEKQLEASREMEAEYSAIRKWNHDMENHLYSLAYLFSGENYDQAREYLEHLLLENQSSQTFWK